MLVRTISALVLLPILIGAIHYGGIYLFFFLLGASLIGLYELFRVFESHGYKPMKNTTYIVTVLTYIFLFYFNATGRGYNLTSVVILVGTIYLIRHEKSLEEIALTVFAYMYIPISLSHIFLVKALGGNYVWIVFILAFATDTCAYLTGRCLGRHKLIPSVSPKKTIEGAVGGIVGAVLCCMLFEYYFGTQREFLMLAVMGLIGSVASQLGDLFASVIKRRFDVKDYGKLIPGHGGVLDRLDSVLFTAPFTYYGFLLMGLIAKWTS